MTIFVTSQLGATLDSIRNACNVFVKHSRFSAKILKLLCAQLMPVQADTCQKLPKNTQKLMRPTIGSYFIGAPAKKRDHLGIFPKCRTSTQRWKNVQTVQTRLCYFFSMAVLIFWLCTRKLDKTLC